MICTNRIKLLKMCIYNNINYIFGTKKNEDKKSYNLGYNL